LFVFLTMQESDDGKRPELREEVLWRGATERPFTGVYNEHFPAEGTYACAHCGHRLFRAEHKFACGCGWPAFFECLPDAVTEHDDHSLSNVPPRIEVRCRQCRGHLGHVFRGEEHVIRGVRQSISRYCINSVVLRFIRP
jgi:peptide-methionine (R)-S-oxide reductase